MTKEALHPLPPDVLGDPPRSNLSRGAAGVSTLEFTASSPPPTTSPTQPPTLPPTQPSGS